MADIRKQEFPYDDFSDLSEVQHPSKYAKIDGILSSLSPMQTSTTGTTKYFNGEITNRKKRLPLLVLIQKCSKSCNNFIKMRIVLLSITVR